jgi:hypothetical protein
MHQVTVRGVNLDNLETRLLGPPGRLDKGLGHGADVVDAHRFRRRVSLVKWNGARRQNGPPSTLVRFNGLVAVPWARRRGLSPRVRQLDARDAALGTDKGRDALQHVDLIVFP